MDATAPDALLYSGMFAGFIPPCRHDREFAEIAAEWPENFVYALIDPRDDRVRYIGVSGNPFSRLVAHASYSVRPEVRDWIRELKSVDMWPRVAILARHRHLVIALHIENQLIAEYEGFHGGLLNRFKRYTTRTKQAALELFGPFARLNFPSEVPA